MNKERDKSYVFGKVCLSKKAFLNLELRQTERNINKGLDIIDRSTKVKNNNEEDDDLSLSNSKFITLSSFTDANLFIQRMNDISARKKSSKLIYPKSFKISNQNSTIRKTRTNMTTRAITTSSKTLVGNKNLSSMTLHKIPLLKLENEEYKPSRTQTQKTLNRFLAKKEIDKYKRKPKDSMTVRRERSYTANPKHKFQMNKLLSLQRKTNEIEQIIKHDRKIENKIKNKTNKLFLSTNIKALKAQRFKELKKDIGMKGKFPKDYFMDRLIKFSALNQRNQIIKFVNSDIAYSHRDVICKTIGFKWKDPFE